MLIFCSSLCWSATIRLNLNPLFFPKINALLYYACIHVYVCTCCQLMPGTKAQQLGTSGISINHSQLTSEANPWMAGSVAPCSPPAYQADIGCRINWLRRRSSLLTELTTTTGRSGLAFRFGSKTEEDLRR